jgi:hypothetical protein
VIQVSAADPPAYPNPTLFFNSGVRAVNVGAVTDIMKEGEAVYFCGNSLGLLSKNARRHMLEELDVWSTR